MLLNRQADFARKKERELQTNVAGSEMSKTFSLPSFLPAFYMGYCTTTVSVIL